MINLLSESQLSEGRYNARDALATARLYKPLCEALQRFDVVNVYLHDREMAKLALAMQLQGMPIDEKERQRVGGTLRQIRDEAIRLLESFTLGPDFIEWIATYQAAKPRKDDCRAGQTSDDGTVESAESAYAKRVVRRRNELVKRWEKLRSKGKNPINIGAKVQLAALLRCAGVELKVLTKSGIPKINKGVLETHAQNSAAKAALNYGITASVIKTFVDNLDVKQDGAIHPRWSIHKITGRWGSNPNVQNWSVRAGGGAENLRRMVKAPEGFVFAGGDFAQIEARILACLSRDALLVKIFADNRDIHAEMAAVGFPREWPGLDSHYKEHGGQVETCKICQARKKARDMTKRLEYGGWYGGKAETVWSAVVKDMPGLMLRDVEAFNRNLASAMPGVIRWRAEVLKEVTATREVRSPFLGRRETFPLGRVDPGVAYNYKAQSGGADLWCLGALDYVKTWPQQGLTSGRIIHNGHDSALILAAKEDAKEIIKDAAAAWSRTINGVTFPMEFKQAERWSET